MNEIRMSNDAGTYQIPVSMANKRARNVMFKPGWDA